VTVGHRRYNAVVKLIIFIFEKKIMSSFCSVKLESEEVREKPVCQVTMGHMTMSLCLSILC
jgi:hypothetical protein